MEILLNLLGAACIGALWVNSEPTMALRELIFKDKQNWFRRLLECCFCISFWIGLAFTQDVMMASIVSVSAEIISRKLNSGSLL
jgi:hypothetical protein